MNPGMQPVPEAPEMTAAQEAELARIRGLIAELRAAVFPEQ